MGSWLRTHKKQVIIHTVIVAAFLLFLLFLAEPLFDRFESIEGESQLHNISLPTVTNNIQSGIDKIDIYTHTIEMDGWAFIKGEGSENSEVYLVLKSDDNTYVFDTVSKIRPDIAQNFSEAGIDLINSGFNAVIPVRKIARGDYILGLYITKDDIQALQYTGDAIVKAGNSARLTVRMSEVQEIPLPPESGEIRLGVDECEAMKDEVEIAGWAFIEGQSTEDSKIYVVLKSERATYVFDTVLWGRPDITAAYVESGLNLDNSGFIARIPVDTLKVGPYELGIYIKKGDIEALQYTGRLVGF